MSRAPNSSTKPASTPFSRIVDLYGKTKAEVDILTARLKQKQEQLAGLRLLVSERTDKLPAETATILEGARYSLQVSERRNERTITGMAGLFDFLKREVFLAHCTFPLKIFDALVPEAKQGEFAKQERTGPRELKPIPAVAKKAA